MLNILKNSFNILKNNPVFIQPLLLFLLIFMTALSYLGNANGYSIAKIILAVSVVLLCIAFTAGWFYIIKNAILTYNENDTKEERTLKSILNFKRFFEGVGYGFLKTFGAYIILFLIYFILMYLSVKLCIKFCGVPQFIYEIRNLFQATSQAEMLNILNAISDADKIAFSVWVIVLNSVMGILNLFLLIYFAAIYFSESNIFKSFWLAVKFSFKNILGLIYILIFTFSLYLIINILSMIIGVGIFALFVMIILFCLYLNYYVLLVFCFYNEKTKNNSNNGTELIG